VNRPPTPSPPLGNDRPENDLLFDVPFSRSSWPIRNFHTSRITRSLSLPCTSTRLLRQQRERKRRSAFDSSKFSSVAASLGRDRIRRVHSSIISSSLALDRINAHLPAVEVVARFRRRRNASRPSPPLDLGRFPQYRLTRIMCPNGRENDSLSRRPHSLLAAPIDLSSATRFAASQLPRFTCR